MLNKLRRECVDKLTLLRITRPTPQFFPVPTINKFNRKLEKAKFICRFESEKQIPEDLSDIYAVMYPIEKAPPLLPEGMLAVADIPRGILSEKAIIEMLKIFKQRGFCVAAAGNISAAQIAANMGFRLFADFGLNVFKSYSAHFWAKNNAKFITVSPELTLKASISLASPALKGIMAYGRLPLMLTSNCPVKNGISCKECNKYGFLTDRLGIKFPVRCRMGFSEVLNSRPTYIGDKPEIFKSFDFLTLYFTTETFAEVRRVISAFKNSSHLSGNVTHGMYIRGVE